MEEAGWYCFFEVCASIDLINIDVQEWEKYVHSRYLPCSVLY
jgi:hypothetical protein